QHLVSNFNAHLRDCVVIFDDEASFAGDKRHENTMKALITEPEIPIEGKGKNLVTAKNYLHVLKASNSEWVVPVSHDGRRYAVTEASADRVGDFDYFAAIDEQMNCGGLAAMMYELLHRDISKFNVWLFPKTGALSEQKRQSLGSIDRWLMTV